MIRLKWGYIAHGVRITHIALGAKIYREIFANLHNDLNNVIMIARAYLMIPFDSTTISKLEQCQFICFHVLCTDNMKSCDMRKHFDWLRVI